MCGLFGYFCKDYNSRLDVAVSILAVAMEARGDHSWGISDGTSILKDTGAISGALNPDMFSGAKHLIGHTRFATIGSRTKENSHPWRFGTGPNEIIGAHNGQISNHTELNKDLDRKFEVDSQHIFQHLLEGRSLTEIRGYGAVCFFKDGKIFLGRFNSGQLAIARTSLGMMFASTAEGVNKALSMSGGKLETFYQVDDEKLYVIENTAEGPGLFNTDIPFRFGSRYEPVKKYGTNSYTGYGRHDWSDDDWKRRYDGTNSGTDSKGRWVNQKWEPGRWIGNVFIHGKWDGDKFEVDAVLNTEANKRLLTEGDSKKSKKKDKSRSTRKERFTKQGKVIPIDYHEADNCVLCQVTFSVDEETWETPMGEMCDSCMEMCFRADQVDADDLDNLISEATIENSVGEGTEKHNSEDPFIITTVRDFIKNHFTAEDVSAKTDTASEKTGCDECDRIMEKDDIIYIDKVMNKIKWVLCPPCHTALTTPYHNTSFNFPS